MAETDTDIYEPHINLVVINRIYNTHVLLVIIYILLSLATLVTPTRQNRFVMSTEHAVSLKLPIFWTSQPTRGLVCPDRSTIYFAWDKRRRDQILSCRVGSRPGDSDTVVRPHQLPPSRQQIRNPEVSSYRHLRTQQARTRNATATPSSTR